MLLRTIAIAGLSLAAVSAPAVEPTAPKVLAKQVTIHRDAWGVPHVFGPTDESVIFGMGYAQSEDYFWRLEDTVIRGIGRYAEVYGESGVRSDMLNRAFEVGTRSKADFEKFSEENRTLGIAFTAGINWYLQHNPHTKPRLIQHFEPWMILAVDRHLLLDFSYGHTHVGRPKALFDTEAELKASAATSPNIDSLAAAARDAIGSNAWAIGPSKTANNSSMLLINPHQPWYGWGQFYEAHLHSDETIRFSGACFFGTPIPTIGHNEHLGWTYTVNEPDNADAWVEHFDSPADPLAYRYADGYRSAIEWKDTVKVRANSTLETRSITFRKTHHGPLVRKSGDNKFIAANVAGIFDLDRMDQALGMIRATNIDQWKAAIGHCALPMFNVAYADRADNILYLYNGSIPIRDPNFDWKSPVDGSDPKTEWQGVHPLHELPQLLNPKCGYVQNCNTSPFITTHDDNPDRAVFNPYMFEDADYEKRRAKRSREILRDASNLTFEHLQQLAFDSKLYWPEKYLPTFQSHLDELNKTDRKLADEIRPYLEHLLNWDCRSTNQSTQTTLCVTWYEELHQGTYPGETFKEKYQDNPIAQLTALKTAADKIEKLYGNWKTPWGEAHRLQRVADKGDVQSAAIALSRFRKSLPCPGAPGPLGVMYTVYSTPAIPLVRPARYGVVGSCYVAVVEFAKDKVRTASAVQFGSSSNRRSRHYFDQAELFSTQKLKPAWFYPEDVIANAVRSYHPGEK
ncbi:MAG: penicillin acylase family protein [Planctomycetales bacterium]|nr:penicillin acylase family protein [Planctomycetales bacterium]